MKLNALYESVTLGAIAMRPAGFEKPSGPDVAKPKGKERWYHRDSPFVLRHKMTDKDKEIYRQRTNYQNLK